jgi:hypothetical protein
MKNAKKIKFKESQFFQLEEVMNEIKQLFLLLLKNLLNQ